jgi:ribosomal protein S6--L-glutamate ligase
LRLCFIVEEEYRDAVMPLAVARELTNRGHVVDLLEPQATATCLSELTRYGHGAYQAYVLKTVSDGPGISLLEAAAAAGIATVNNARSVRLVRDKAVCATYARRHGIAFPVTYFVAAADLLHQVPDDQYPLVVKPSNGSSCRGIHRIRHRGQLRDLEIDPASDRFFLAQPYVANSGVDVKLYSTGSGNFAVQKHSPLHPDSPSVEGLIPLTPELDEIANRVGHVFGLDIFGVDVVATADGWVALDINDFPSFGLVPNAAGLMAETIERIAARAAREREASALLRRPIPAVEPQPSPDPGRLRR